VADTIPRYAWRARAYPWARQVIAAAEAGHGTPDAREIAPHVVSRRRRAARLRADGMTLREIAGRLGVSHTAVRSDLEWHAEHPEAAR
jgi:DNA-binding NarL/FixJ family response regulator